MKPAITISGPGSLAKLSCVVPPRHLLRQWASCIVATLAWAGFLPNTLHGIGISPGSARITLELVNTNVVPKTFTVSFWPT